MPIFIERDEYEFFLRSVKFCDKIDTYRSLLGIDEAEVNSYKNENELFNYVFAHQSSYGTLAESFMRYKISNMQSLFYDLCSKCRNSRNYTERIGADLGITTGDVPKAGISRTPLVNIALNSEGHPVLKWKQGIFENVEIWKDTGNGRGYQKLDNCRNTIYTDYTSLPVNKCEVWKYSLIYLFKDEMVGNWSDEQEVIVYQEQNR